MKLSILTVVTDRDRGYNELLVNSTSSIPFDELTLLVRYREAHYLMQSNAINKGYLQTKRDKLGHFILKEE